MLPPPQVHASWEPGKMNFVRGQEPRLAVGEEAMREVSQEEGGKPAIRLEDMGKGMVGFRRCR